MNRSEAGDREAFVDESVRARAAAPGVYVVAAVVVEDSVRDVVRDQVRGLAPRSGRLHWRDESHANRRKVAAAVAVMPIHCHLVVGEGMAARGQERARKLCLRRLLQGLDEASVTRVTLETRGPIPDGRDIAAVTAFRHGRILGKDHPGIGHALPSSEPLLWVADVLAGARSAVAAGATEHFETLKHLVVEDVFDVMKP